MKVYQINYDLRKQRNYDELYKKIKAYGTWCRPLKSCWIIISDKSAMEILKDLRQALDNDDGLLVTRLQRDAAWVNLDSDKDKSMTNWLKKYIGAAS